MLLFIFFNYKLNLLTNKLESCYLPKKTNAKRNVSLNCQPRLNRFILVNLTPHSLSTCFLSFTLHANYLLCNKVSRKLSVLLINRFYFCSEVYLFIHNLFPKATLYHDNKSQIGKNKVCSIYNR